MGKFFLFVFSTSLLFSYNIFSSLSSDESSVIVRSSLLQHELNEQAERDRRRDERIASIISLLMVEHMNYEGLGKCSQTREIRPHPDPDKVSFGSQIVMPELEVYARAFSADKANALLNGDTLFWKVGEFKIAKLNFDISSGTWHYRQLQRVNL